MCSELRFHNTFLLNVLTGLTLSVCVRSRTTFTTVMLMDCFRRSGFVFLVLKLRLASTHNIDWDKTPCDYIAA